MGAEMCKGSVKPGAMQQIDEQLTESVRFVFQQTFVVDHIKLC